MSQRFCLFYAGYTAYAPMLYYDQVALYGQLMAVENEVLKRRVLLLMEGLEETKHECKSHIETTNSIANDLSIAISPKPDSGESYLNWRNGFQASVEERFPMTRIDHYYFTFGRRLAEMYANTELVSKYISLIKGTERHAMLVRKVDKSLKDMEFILFKMMAPAALLSGEHRHHYMSVYYKEISNEFKKIAAYDFRQLSDERLADLERDINLYGQLVMNGFKKCVSLLKELAV